MAWDDEARRAARARHQKLGKLGSYRPVGHVPITTTIILEKGVAAYPSEEEPLVNGPLNVASVLVEDVPDPGARDDELRFGDDETYRVDELLKNDGFVADLRVR